MKRVSLTLVLLGTLLGFSGAAAAEPGCIPTRGDYLGPFYISGTTEGEELNRRGRPGEPLLVTGRVFSAAAGHSALAGARVEVWQTDGAGNYYPEGSGDAADYAPEELDLRGTLTTDGSGRYRFNTVVPGSYFPRPRHFHFRLSAVDHKPLVTQLYITGDGSLQQPGGNCRHAPLIKTADGYLYESPDIYLQPVE